MYSYAKLSDLTKAEEKYWKEAEKAVKDQYDPEEEPEIFYGTVTQIFKAKVKKHLGYDPYKKRKKKKKKKSEWAGRAYRFEKYS